MESKIAILCHQLNDAIGTEGLDHDWIRIMIELRGHERVLTEFIKAREDIEAVELDAN